MTNVNALNIFDFIKVLLSLSLLSCLVLGEPVPRGEQFIVGFLKAHVNCSLELWITPQQNRTLTLNVSSKNTVIYEGTGTGQEIIRVTVPSQFHMSGSNIESKGISVKSSEEILLHVRTICSLGGTAYLALPTESLSTDYCMVSYLYSVYGMSVLGVVATSDNTNIVFELPTNRNITIRHRDNIYQEGGCISETLNALETLQLQSSDDLTGVFIRASKPIVALEGFAEFVPSNRGVYTMHSVMVGQLQPPCNWGTAFMTVPMMNTSTTVRIVAIEDNSDIYMRTMDSKLEAFALEKGDFRDVHLQQSRLIWLDSLKPISAIQINVQHGSTERPYSNTLTPIDHYSNSYVYATPDSSQNNYSLYIAVPQELKEEVYLDSLSLSEKGISWERQLGIRRNLSTAVIQVEPGLHRITVDSTHGFLATLRSDGENGSFWLPLGMNSSSVRAGCSMCCNVTDVTCDGTKHKVYTDANAVTNNISSNYQINITENPVKNTQISQEAGESKAPGMNPYVLSIVVSLCCAVTLVFLCILGFTIAEFYCRRDDFRNRND